MERLIKSNSYKLIVLALIPIVYCLIYCLMEGQSLFDVYLPASEWNDELFYYKQVESILNYGYPRGYFGYNESHALQLSFAAWSPVLVFPWVIWGAVFGWNFMSPMLCNIVLMTVAMILFGVLVKPSWKQIGVLAVLYALFTPFVRYMLSGMPEVICFSTLIVFYSLALNYLDKETSAKLVWLFILSAMMTLMRPYLILFMLLPAYLLIRKKRWIGAIVSGVLFVITLAVYFAINHFLGAEYFVPLFDLDWLVAFFEKGLFGGAHYFLSKLYWNGLNFMEHVKDGIRVGLASGAFFAGYLMLMVLLVIQCGCDFWNLKKSSKQSDKGDADKKGLVKLLVVELHLAICFFGMLVALLLMYDLKDGSKHFLIFMSAAVFVISILRTKFYGKAIVAGVTFLYFYVLMAANPYDYQVPFKSVECVSQTEKWEAIFEENIAMHESEAITYKNNVIWVFSDFVRNSDTQEMESVRMKWQLLYGIPEGIGISCCMSDYITDNIDELQSKYIVTLSDGQVDALCAGKDYIEVSRDKDIVLYERY